MKDFVIKIDLSNFFSDERKCSLLYIDSAWKTISDLQAHIQNLFNLNDIHLLTNDGCFLPPKESIKITKSFEAAFIKAFVFESPVDESQLEKSNRKRKKRSMETELTSSTPYQPKRSKNISAHSPQASINDVTSMVQNPFREDETSKTNSNANVDKITKLTQETAKEAKKDDTSVSNINKTANLEFLSIKSSGNNIDKDIVDKKSTFDTEEKSKKLVDKEIVFRCPLMELDSNKARIFHLPKKCSKIQILGNVCISKPLMIPTNDNLLVDKVCLAKAIDCGAKQAESPKTEGEMAPECQTAIVDEEEKAQPPLSPDSDDSVMLLEDDTRADDSDSDVLSVVETCNDNQDLESDMLRNAVPMTDLPILGDTVLFKLPKIKNSKTYGNTNFIAGSCCYVNRRSKAITFSVISCPPGIQDVLSQYCTNLDNSNLSILNLNFKDLIEPQVIVPTID